MKPLRAALWCGLLLLAALLLAACAGDDATDQQPPASTPTGPAIAAPSATAAPTVSLTPTLTTRPPTPRPVTTTGAPTMTLTLWTNEQGESLTLVRTLAAEFAQQASISITVEARPRDSLRLSLLAAELADEPPPALIWGSHNDLAELLLDERIQSIGPAAQASHVLPALVTSASAQGRLWGEPLAATESLLLLANGTLAPQMPATTDELIAQSRAVQAPERAGIVAAWDEARWLLAWLNGYGGAPTTPDGTRPTLNTPQMRSALNLLLELVQAAPDEQFDYASARAYFTSQQAAFMVDGTWALPDYRNPVLALNLQIAPMPRVPATGRRAAPALGGTYLMYHRTLSGEELRQARAFGGYLQQPEIQIRLARALQRPPALRAVLAAPPIAGDAQLVAASAQAAEAIGLPPTQALRCALQSIETRLGPLLAGEIDQQTAAEEMQQQAEQCLGS
jgi:ABC-type glycerol-3-phosphate transport system substrate-binding protein